MTKARGTLFIVLNPTGTDPSPLLMQLQEHPDVLCHAGMQGPLSKTGVIDKVLDSLLTPGDVAFRNDFPEAFLYKYVFDSRGRQAVGFAVDHDTLLDPMNARMRNVVYQDTGVDVLLYMPRDILRAYAEDVRRRQASLLARSGPVEIEPHKFLLHARQMDRMNAYFEEFFANHRRLKVDGGYLSTPKANATLKSIAKFLEVGVFPPAASPAAEEPPVGLREMISNYDAVEAALRGTPYTQLLES